MLALRTSASTLAYQAAISVPRNGCTAIDRNKRKTYCMPVCAATRSEASLVAKGIFSDLRCERPTWQRRFGSPVWSCALAAFRRNLSTSNPNTKRAWEVGVQSESGPPRTVPVRALLGETGCYWCPLMAYRNDGSARRRLPQPTVFQGMRAEECQDRSRLQGPSTTGGGERPNYKQGTELSEANCPIYGSGRRRERA